MTGLTKNAAPKGGCLKNFLRGGDEVAEHAKRKAAEAGGAVAEATRKIGHPTGFAFSAGILSRRGSRHTGCAIKFVMIATTAALKRWNARRKSTTQNTEGDMYLLIRAW